MVTVKSFFPLLLLLWVDINIKGLKTSFLRGIWNWQNTVWRDCSDIFRSSYTSLFFSLLYRFYLLKLGKIFLFRRLVKLYEIKNIGMDGMLSEKEKMKYICWRASLFIKRSYQHYDIRSIQNMLMILLMTNCFLKIVLLSFFSTTINIAHLRWDRAIPWTYFLYFIITYGFRE